MTIRVAINGFGRIGRHVLRRVALGVDDVEVVAINSNSTTPEIAAHMFKYDSVFGRYRGEVAVERDGLIIGGRHVRVTSHRDPVECPWGAEGIEVVVEATGLFTERSEAARHLRAGAGRVVVTAPARGADATIVVGVNDGTLDPERHQVVSAASCTTNCLAPVISVMAERFGIASGLMTTIHAFTRDQELLDGRHTDLRRARAATLNMCPTKTGAAKLIDVVLPELAGRFTGLAVRVPLPDISLVDLTAVLDEPATEEEVNGAFLEAAAGALKGILATTDEPLVSSDFHGDDHSAIVDLPSTRRVDGGRGDAVKVLAWYDNEAGYAARVVDLIRLVGVGARSVV